MNEYTRYLGLKSILEDVLGSDAWYALKESNSLSTWKKYLIKAVKSIHLTIKSTVEVYDQDWLDQISEIVIDGEDSIKRASDIEEAISALAETFIRISFLQTGFMPYRKGVVKNHPLRKDLWKFNQFRTVIYTQNDEQKIRLYRHKLRIKIGSQSEIELWNEYLRSHSSKKYQEWIDEKSKGE